MMTKFRSLFLTLIVTTFAVPLAADNSCCRRNDDYGWLWGGVLGAAAGAATGYAAGNNRKSSRKRCDDCKTCCECKINTTAALDIQATYDSSEVTAEYQFIVVDPACNTIEDQAFIFDNQGEETVTLLDIDAQDPKLEGKYTVIIRLVSANMLPAPLPLLTLNGTPFTGYPSPPEVNNVGDQVTVCAQFLDCHCK